ncbi:MAG: hypothetical protein IPG53_14245 [Ignavibacteriales bacterium]|nr:hypothetical protein [Ignavibacteriales bacterium]
MQRLLSIMMTRDQPSQYPTMGGVQSKGDTPVTSFGLLGMRERAKLINAHLNVNSVENSGTTVTIKVDNAKIN